jgi:hypothetical protein
MCFSVINFVAINLLLHWMNTEANKGCDLLNTSAYTAGVARIFQTSRRHHKILGVRRMTWNKFHTEDQKTLGATS